MTKVRTALAALGLVLLTSCGTGGTGGTASSTTHPIPAATTTSASTPGLPASVAPFLPLWPFQSSVEVQSWQQTATSAQQASWHLSAGATALNFTMSYLGFTAINTVVATTTDATGAHVTVGYHPMAGQTSMAAVIHLVRWGTGSAAPWEVVGTDDTTFSLTTPAYGATMSSPLTVGGVITGADESIRVMVLQVSSTAPLGSFCCRAAGGSASPWSAIVSFVPGTDPVFTVVASTGGHVQATERFTVTGIRRRTS